MTERPILMSAPMVRACLAGTKTQTRRVIRGDIPADFLFDPTHGAIIFGNTVVRCPYGAAGGRLWVRETWGTGSGPAVIVCSDQPHVVGTVESISGDVCLHVHHRAGKESYAWGMYGPPKWKPSIHMPRTACRLVLEVAAVRVERLQEINEDDAMAEGCASTAVVNAARDDYTGLYASEHYAQLWDSLNAKRGFAWSTNPWVWVVEFKRA